MAHNTTSNTSNQPTWMNIQESYLRTDGAFPYPMENLNQEIDFVQKEFLTPEKAAESINSFDGQNMNPLLFIASCENAYDKINPLDIGSLTNLIRSKIVGELNDFLISQTELNFDDLMLKLKLMFKIKSKLEFAEELYKQEQKLYESPMRFGKRLLNLLRYLEENLHKSKINEDINILNVNLIFMEQVAISIFIKKIINNEFRITLKEKKPNSMIQAIEFAQQIWNSNNAIYEVYPYDLLLFENTNCLYCEDKKLHCHDCPFQNKFHMNTLNLRRIVLYNKPYENMPPKQEPTEFNHFNTSPFDFFHIMECPDEIYNSLKYSPILADTKFRTMLEKYRERLKTFDPNNPPTLAQQRRAYKELHRHRITRISQSGMVMRSRLPRFPRFLLTHDPNSRVRLNNRLTSNMKNTYIEKESLKLCTQLVNLKIGKSSK